MILLEIVIFIAGFALGSAIVKLFLTPKYVGLLKSVRTEHEEQPTLLLDLYDSVESVSQSNYVTFKVERIDLQSR